MFIHAQTEQISSAQGEPFQKAEANRFAEKLGGLLLTYRIEAVQMIPCTDNYDIGEEARRSHMTA